jgi:hypothetical protein
MGTFVLHGKFLVTGRLAAKYPLHSAYTRAYIKFADIVPLLGAQPCRQLAARRYYLQTRASRIALPAHT